MHPYHSSALLILLFAVASTSFAAEVYSWVDESGQKHYSDKVPERYKATARPISIPPTAVSDADRNAANVRLKKQLADLEALDRARAARTQQMAASSPASAAAGPARMVPNLADCTIWWRQFKESRDCFAPFMKTIGGSLKPEAYDFCTEIPNPEPKCGPEKR